MDNKSQPVSYVTVFQQSFEVPIHLLWPRAAAPDVNRAKLPGVTARRPGSSGRSTGTGLKLVDVRF